jgi:hypothetical protein
VFVLVDGSGGNLAGSDLAEEAAHGETSLHGGRSGELDDQVRVRIVSPG